MSIPKNAMPGGGRPRWRGTVLLVALLGLWPGLGLAGQAYLHPTLQLQQEYNDNLFFTAAAKEGDFLTTLRLGVEGGRRDERGAAGLSGAIGWLDYAEQDKLDTVDQSYQGHYSFALSPRLKVTAQGSFGRDSRADRELEATGLVLGTVRRDRLGLGGGGEYILDELTRLSGEAGFARDDFATSDFASSKSWSGDLIWQRALSETANGEVSLEAFRTEYADARVDNVSLLLGGDRVFASVWTLDGAAGVRHTRSTFRLEQLEFDPLQGFFLVSSNEKQQEWGWVVRGGLNWQGERQQARLSASRDLSTVSGRSGAVERTSLGLEASHHFTEHLSATLGAGGFLNRGKKDELSAAGIDEVTWRLHTGMLWRPLQELALEAAWSYARVDNRESDVAADRHTVWLRLTGRYPILE